MLNWREGGAEAVVGAIEWSLRPRVTVLKKRNKERGRGLLAQCLWLERGAWEE